MSGSGRTPLLGREERLHPADAALVNCLASAADTFDDTHLTTITHPTGPVAAVILALADTHRISGQDLLAALAIGIEIECRISAAITAPGVGASQGWYMTGISGGVGAAAAAARILHASHDEIVSAIGLATSQAGGLRATHGSMAIAFVPGFAARNGITAACLAVSGFRCGDLMIEGKNGLFPVLAPAAVPEAIVRGLGSHFEILGNAYKPYPCGIVIHPSIDACLDIARRCPSADKIERVELGVHADALALCWRKLPTSVLEAQVSLFHWAAAALVRRAAGIAEGNAEAVADPAIRAIQEAIQAKVDPALASGQAYAEVWLKDGTKLRAEIVHASGSLERPMTDEQLADKFRSLACYRLNEDQTEKLLQACLYLPNSVDAGEIGRLAVNRHS
jgi:2-methylcitrate dehydratase PrpD